MTDRHSAVNQNNIQRAYRASGSVYRRALSILSHGQHNHIRKIVIVHSKNIDWTRMRVLVYEFAYNVHLWRQTAIIDPSPLSSGEHPYKYWNTHIYWRTTTYAMVNSHAWHFQLCKLAGSRASCRTSSLYAYAFSDTVICVRGTHLTWLLGVTFT